jgi:hypothetical protein
MASTITLPKLDVERPALGLPSMLRSINEQSRSLCPSLCGLPESYWLTGIQWSAKHGNAPRETHTKPAATQAGDSHATISLKKEQNEIFHEVTSGKIILKNAITEAAGSDILAGLRHATTGLADVSIIQLIEYLCTEYSQPTDDDIAYLKAQIAEPFTSESDIRSGAIRHQHLFEHLKQVKREQSDGDQMEAFSESIKNIPRAVAALQHYKQTTRVENRTLKTLKSEVILNYGNFPTATPINNYAHATIASAPISTTSTSATHDALLAKLTQLLDLQSKQINPNRQGKVKDKYCFAHGWNASHKGMECHKMKDPKNNFTMVQRQQTKP